MPLERKQPEPEQQAGAPEWMVTFSDCMTLLLTFFVLLLSFSSFDDRADFRKMNSAFANQISFGAKDKAEKEAVSTIQIQSPNDDLQLGSEKPTLIDGDKNRFKKKTEPEDYLRLRTLLVASDEVFWGDGSVISQRGQQILADVSLFLKELPGQMIIVSESGPKPSKKPEDIGFERAWNVCRFMTENNGLDPQQLTLSAAGTAAKEYHLSNAQRNTAESSDRVLEIIFLNRSL